MTVVEVGILTLLLEAKHVKFMPKSDRLKLGNRIVLRTRPFIVLSLVASNSLFSRHHVTLGRGSTLILNTSQKIVFTQIVFCKIKN